MRFARHLVPESSLRLRANAFKREAGDALQFIVDQPRKMSPRVTAWRIDDVLDWLRAHG